MTKMRRPANPGMIWSLIDKPVKTRTEYMTRYSVFRAMEHNAQLDSGIKNRDILRKKVCIRGLPREKILFWDGSSSGSKDRVITSRTGIIIQVVKNGEVLKYPSAVLNSFPRENDAINGPYIERRSVLGDIENVTQISTGVRFGHKISFDQKSVDKGRNGYVGYQHIRADDFHGLNLPSLDILAFSGSASTKLLSYIGAWCAVNQESGNRVIPTKLEFCTYLFLANRGASKNWLKRGSNPASLDILGPALEFLDNIFATAHKRGLATEELGIVIFSRFATRRHERLDIMFVPVDICVYQWYQDELKLSEIMQN